MWIHARVNDQGLTIPSIRNGAYRLVVGAMAAVRSAKGRGKLWWVLLHFGRATQQTSLTHRASIPRDAVRTGAILFGLAPLLSPPVEHEEDATNNSQQSNNTACYTSSNGADIRAAVLAASPNGCRGRAGIRRRCYDNRLSDNRAALADDLHRGLWILCRRPACRLRWCWRFATLNYRSRFWRRITACALRARGLPAQLKIDVEPFVLVAALLGREARTVFLAVVQAELRAGRVVGAIAVLPLYDSESECAFLAAVVRAVAVRLVGPCIDAVVGSVVWRAVFA